MTARLYSIDPHSQAASGRPEHGQTCWNWSGLWAAAGGVAGGIGRHDHGRAAAVVPGLALGLVQAVPRRFRPTMFT
jgi:hypothetical protein